MLGNKLRLKAAIPISGGLNDHFTMRAFEVFAGGASTGIASAKAMVVLLITQVMGQLCL